MGGNGHILAAALEYSNAIFAGALAYWLLSTLTSVVRGTGQVGVLAAVYLAAEVLHVMLVPILVFGIGPIPPLGITGAGVATITSFTVSTVVLAWYLASGRTAVTLSLRGIRFDPRCFARFSAWGAAVASTPPLQLWARRSHGLRRHARRGGTCWLWCRGAVGVCPVSVDLRPWCGTARHGWDEYRGWAVCSRRAHRVDCRCALCGHDGRYWACLRSFGPTHGRLCSARFPLFRSWRRATCLSWLSRTRSSG